MTQPQPYQPPTLEQHEAFTILTGVSLPIGTTTLPDLDTLEFGLDVLGGKQ